MKLPLLVLSLLALWPQDRTSEIRTLIERLRSNEIKEREEAALKLVDLGVAARPVLEETARGTDAESSARAKEILARIDLRLRLAGVFKALPTAENRLRTGDDRAWMEILIEATEEDSARTRRYPSLVAKDLEPLAPRALRAMKGDREIEKVCGIIEGRRLMSAKPVLDELARSIDLEPSFSAGSTVCRLADRSDIPKLISLLEGKPVAYNYVFPALERLRAREAIPALRRFLKHPNYNVRRESLRLLASLRAPEASADILPLLEDPHWNVKYWALQTLADLGNQKAAPGIARELKSEETPIRREAAVALGMLGAREALPELRILLQDPNSQVRGAAARALAMLEDRVSAMKIAEFLPKESDGSVQKNYLESLARLNIPETLPAIRQCLKDSMASVRSAAATCLGDMNIKEAYPEILPLLKDDHGDVFLAAADALARLDEKETSRQLIRQIGDPAHRVLAVMSLARMGSREAARALEPLSPEAYEDLLNNTPLSLRILEVRSIIPALRESVGKDTGLALPAAELLGEFRDRESIPAIRKLLGNERNSQHARIGLVLAKLGDREAAPALEKLLARTLDDRCTAAHALARMGRDAGVPVLLEAAAAEHVSLTPLNALRSPAAWARLEQASLQKEFRGTRREALEELARALRLPLEVPSPQTDGGEYWLASRLRSPFAPQGTALLDWFDEVLPFFSNPPFELILEADRVRVMPRIEALEFWEGWWASSRDK